eukprot:11212371-Prorocentrum_lima.AAC.1
MREQAGRATAASGTSQTPAPIYEDIPDWMADPFSTSPHIDVPVPDTGSDDGALLGEAMLLE